MSDLIERQIAENAICNACGKIDCDQMDTCEMLKLPSVQPDLPIKEKCAFCPHCNNCDVNDDLSIQPCVDTISRKAAIDALWKALYEYEDKTEKQFIESEELDVADWIQHRIFVQNMSDIDRQTIRDLPSAQPVAKDINVPINDCISRQAAIDAHYEYCNKHPDAGFPVWSLKILENLPSAQPELIEKVAYIRGFEQGRTQGMIDTKAEEVAQPETHEERTETHACDLIDRQDAIDALDKRFDSIPMEQTTEILLLRKDLRNLPSAQPEVLACGEGELIAQPEIIRCKGCKHQVKEWRTDKRLKDNGYMVCGCDVVGDSCGFWALLGQDDDYCSYAERRTDDPD